MLTPPYTPRPADIIQYLVDRHAPESSQAIAMGERALGYRGKQYSHTALVAAIAGHQWEAKVPFVTLSSVDKSRRYQVWTFDDLTDDDRTAILRYAAAKKGHLYDMAYIFTFGVVRLPGLYVCCEYVGDCYAHGAKRALRDRTPDDIPKNRGIRLAAEYTPETL